jgi:diadenosine tetraphosphatase ApaH/serine/threonine PP2A family protein phosphatase
VRIAILSDIHGNTEALESCLQAVGSVDSVWSTGDTVGYGAEPNACVQRLREVASAVVLGNHDAAAIGKLDVGDFGPVARRSAYWTRGQVDAKSRTYLEGLPLTLCVERVRLVHGTPGMPHEWDYLFGRTQAEFEFTRFSEWICFVGHTHLPVVYEASGSGTQALALNGTPLTLANESRYIINVGSVGQPRDGDPRASFGVLDTERWTLEIRRVPYDVAKTQAKIRAAGLPERLAARLAFGE